jgi:opacity protein-like surface antigen
MIVAAMVCLPFTGAFAKAFVGVSAGQGSTEIDAGGGQSFAGDDTSFKVLGGWRVMKFFAVEADYRDLGSQSDMVLGEEFVIDTSSFDLFAVGVIPVGSAFEIFGKAGYSMWDAEMRITGVPGSGSDSGNDIAYGLGAAYNFGDKFALRLEYELFEIESNADISMASIGAEFRF